MIDRPFLGSAAFVRPAPRAARWVALPSLLLMFLLVGCDHGPPSDAFGNFEATEITVSAEAQGRLLQLDVREGNRLDEGTIAGLVDTTQLALRRRALEAQARSLAARERATLARIPEIEAEVAALDVQLETAQTELDRTQRLHADGAATDRELTQRSGEVRVLEKQVSRARASIRRVREEAESLRAQMQQVESQIGEINTQMQDARVVNPVTGTVLSVFAKRGESVQMGVPLYTIAFLDTLELRAYATGAQLPRLRLGMPVDVLVDGENGGLHTLGGTVVHIASDAQFTPTPIQTREERAALVYAFDVEVPNPNGLLKVGMPGEVRFRSPEDADAMTDTVQVPEPRQSSPS